jgi:two-component system, OmpR family, phosphate regulon response regulator PhoB
MSAKILIVEDEPAIAELLRYTMASAGFGVVTSGDGEDAETLAVDENPDLIVLDWMLPSVSGIELCRRLRTRKETQAIPIIMLTARGEEADKLRGLTTGADDYMVKPFSTPELVARVKAILRRAAPERVADVLTVGDVMLDRTAHRVTRSGRDIRIGPTEFRLLDVLMESSGRVLTRGQLQDKVWGRDVEVDERTVDVHIGRLRKSLVRGTESDPIRTVRGTGYAMGGE